jgi:4-amino-4-deoxy-L-arabinose transferase-like glycosyltransferase
VTACLVNGLLLTVAGLALLWSTPAVLVNAFILVVGLGFVFLGLEIDDGRWLMPLLDRARGMAHRLGVTPLQVLLLLDGLLLACGAASATGDEPVARSALHGWLWVAGIVLTAAGLWDRTERPHLDRSSVIPLTLATGFVLLALALRLVRLDTIPFAVNGDEGSGALTGLEYLRQTRSSLFGTAWHSFPSFYFWLISLSQQWLGPTLLAARLPSAVGGTLAVLATFWTGSRLYGRVQGAAAALLLAGSHVHLMFSRIAVNNVWDSLFLVLAIGAVWVAWVQNARWAFLLTGVAVGLGQLFYPTGRLLMLAVPLWLLILAAIRPSAGRRSGVLSLALLTLVTVLPLAMFYTSHPNEFIAPLSGVAVSEISGLLGSEGLASFSMGTLPEQFRTSALGLVVAPLFGIYHPSQPMLLPPGAVLFCLGALLLLREARDPRSLILLSALFGALLAGTLSVEAPNAHRMQGILPVLALIAARGPAWLVEQATRAPTPGLRRVALGCALAGVAFVAGREARFFFFEAIPAGAYGDSATFASRSISEFAANLPAGTAVVLFGEPRLTFANFPSLNYLIGDRPICDGSWPLRPECEVNRDGAAFVFLHEQQATLPAIRAAYPTGQQVAFDEMPGNPPALAWVVSE